ncbi:EI24 domain-containing protein [Bacteriovoracaceae bacterium]|nr:EI24 domain-containing protein [Bacteriovoracaceae bacterium]
MIKSFKTTIELIKKDRWLKFYLGVPQLVSAIIYLFIANWLYTDLKIEILSAVQDKLGVSESYIISMVINLLLTIGLYFIVNLGFVLSISLLASPFHDLVSKRTLVLLGMKESNNAKFSLRQVLGTLTNEFKKIIFIFVLMGISFLLGMIPILTPFCFVLSALLVSIQFLDYSWAQEDWTLKQCISDIWHNLFVYVGSGAIVLFLISIPVINILSISLPVVYYSALWYEKNAS